MHWSPGLIILEVLGRILEKKLVLHGWMLDIQSVLPPSRTRELVWDVCEVCQNLGIRGAPVVVVVVEAAAVVLRGKGVAHRRTPGVAAEAGAVVAAGGHNGRRAAGGGAVHREGHEDYEAVGVGESGCRVCHDAVGTKEEDGQNAFHLRGVKANEVPGPDD